MFTEILRIKPYLDRATTALMERNLGARFARVAKRFGASLKNVVSGRGLFLGIGLAFLNKLLNPLNELEEKIKSLLGQGTDIRDLADRFQTTPGQLKRLQDVAQSLGVKPDELREMLGKYAQAVETARKEIADPANTDSASTEAVRQFVNEKDLAEGFFSFIQSLKAASPEIRSKVEESVFGERQYGANRRFIEASFPQALSNIPSVQRSGKAIENLATQSDLQNQIQAVNQSQDLIAASARITSKMIRDIELSEKLKNDRETKQLESFNDLKKAALAIEEVKNGFQNVIIMINKGIGHLADLVSFTMKLKETRWFKGFFGGK